MGEKRIIEYTEQSSVDNTDYMLTDSGTKGSKKYQVSRILSEAAADAQTKVDAEAAAREAADNELKADLTLLSENELFFDTIIGNEYVDKTTGADVPYNNWSRTDFIDITGVVGFVAYNDNAGGDYNAFYDADKNFISKITILTTPTYIAVPSNAVYMKCSADNVTIKHYHIKCLYNNTLLIGGSHAALVPFNNAKIKITRASDTVTLIFPAWMAILYSNEVGAHRFYEDVTVTHTTTTGSNNFALIFNAKTKTLRIVQPIDLSVTGDVIEKDEFLICSFYIDSNNRLSVDLPGELVDISGNNDLDIPKYYRTHMDAKIDTVNNIGQNIMNGDSFVFITDCHYPNPSSTMSANTKHSPALIKELKKKTGVRFVVNGGDNFDSQDTVADMIDAQLDFATQFDFLKTDEYYSVIGNHEWYTDLNSDPRVIPTYSALRYAIINKFTNSILWLDEYGDYYYDNVAQKIRYFVISCDFDTATPTEQIHTILDEFKNIPDGYHLMVIDHAMANDEITAPRHWQICRGLEILKNKSSDTISGVLYNYSNKNVDVLPVLCGHTHFDGSFTSGSGILVIATTTDAWARQTTASGLPRTVGTYTEQAFDVVQMDMDERKIYLTRIGAGNNRTFSY